MRKVQHSIAYLTAFRNKKSSRFLEKVYKTSIKHLKFKSNLNITQKSFQETIEYPKQAQFMFLNFHQKILKFYLQFHQE